MLFSDPIVSTFEFRGVSPSWGGFFYRVRLLFSLLSVVTGRSMLLAVGTSLGRLLWSFNFIVHLGVLTCGFTLGFKGTIFPLFFFIDAHP